MVELVDVREVGFDEHFAAEPVEFCAVALFAAGDDVEGCAPVFKEVVEEEAWGVGGAVGGFFLASAETLAERELDEGGVAEGGGRFAELAEDVDEVAAGGEEGAEVLGCEDAVGEGERVFGDGDYGFAFTEGEPVPDTAALWYFSALVGPVVVVLSVYWFAAYVVECVVANTHICASVSNLLFLKSFLRCKI